MPDTTEWLLVNAFTMILTVHAETLEVIVYLKVSAPSPDGGCFRCIGADSLNELFTENHRLRTCFLERACQRMFAGHAQAFGLPALHGPLETLGVFFGSSCY